MRCLSDQGRYLAKRVSFAFLLFIFLKAFDVFFPEIAGGYPLYLCLYPLYLILLFWALIKHRACDVCVYFAILVLLAGGVTATGIYFKIAVPFEQAKLRVFFLRYEECKKQASAEDGQVALKICENNDRARYLDAIIYDGSDEIMLPGTERSVGWWHKAKSQYDDASFEQFEFVSKKIGQHFYYVKFSLP